MCACSELLLKMDRKCSDLQACNACFVPHCMVHTPFDARGQQQIDPDTAAAVWRRLQAQITPNSTTCVSKPQQQVDPLVGCIDRNCVSTVPPVRQKRRPAVSVVVQVFKFAPTFHPVGSVCFFWIQRASGDMTLPRRLELLRQIQASAAPNRLVELKAHMQGQVVQVLPTCMIGNACCLHRCPLKARRSVVVGRVARRQPLDAGSWDTGLGRMAAYHRHRGYPGSIPDEVP